MRSSIQSFIEINIQSSFELCTPFSHIELKKPLESRRWSIEVKDNAACMGLDDVNFWISENKSHRALTVAC